MQKFKAADYKAEHFKWEVDGKVGTITLNRPERKNPLTFESYAELRRSCSASSSTPATSRRWWSPAPAATSAPAATCTRSSARWSGCRKPTTCRAC